MRFVCFFFYLLGHCHVRFMHKSLSFRFCSFVRSFILSGIFLHVNNDIVQCVNLQMTKAEPWDREARWTKGVATRTRFTRGWVCCCRGTAVPDRSPKTCPWQALTLSPCRVMAAPCPRSRGPRRLNTKRSKNSRLTASDLLCPCRGRVPARPALWPGDIP